MPLITAEGGRKFGKSTGNAVWLSAEKSSSFQLYQFFVRSTDADVERYLKMFTFLELQKIDEIIREHRKNPEERTAQKILAKEVTLLVHGESGLEKALNATSVLYNTSLEVLEKFSAVELMDIFLGASTVDIIPDPGMTVLEVAMKAGCFKTDHEARRIIKAGGFYINHRRTTNDQEVLVDGIHVLKNNVTLLRVGKKSYYIVRWL